MTLFRRKPAQHLPLRINHGLTLGVWQSRPHYVTWAREFFKSHMGSELVSVLRNNQPFVVARNLSATDAAIELGRVRGYMEAVNTLAELAMDRVKLPKDVEVTYGADEMLKQEGIEADTET